MNPVIQEDPTGCGIAAVAAAKGISYYKVKRAAASLGISVQDRRLWSDTRGVRMLLKHFGLRAAPKEIPFRSWKTLPDRALLSVKWHRQRGHAFWHWVLFVREGGNAYVLDSKKSLRQHRRTDFGRLRPTWIIGLPFSH
jgi:hypothetical protein